MTASRALVVFSGCLLVFRQKNRRAYGIADVAKLSILARTRNLMIMACRMCFSDLSPALFCHWDKIPGLRQGWRCCGHLCKVGFARWNVKLASLGKTQACLLGKCFASFYRQKNIRTKETLKNLISLQMDLMHIPILQCLHLWCWSATLCLEKNRSYYSITIAAMPSFLARTRNLMMTDCRMSYFCRRHLWRHLD